MLNQSSPIATLYLLPTMAESSGSSSNVATVAIVVIVLIAAIAIYMFVIRDSGHQNAPDGPHMELEVNPGKG